MKRGILLLGIVVTAYLLAGKQLKAYRRRQRRRGR
jgi:hypothetical protein